MNCEQSYVKLPPSTWIISSSTSSASPAGLAGTSAFSASVKLLRYSSSFQARIVFKLDMIIILSLGSPSRFGWGPPHPMTLADLRVVQSPHPPTSQLSHIAV